MSNTKKLAKKEPSRKFQDAIHDMIGSFQKTATSIELVFSVGRSEGFTDVEIGNMIRNEMLAAGYSLRTKRRALPLTSKQIHKTRKDYSDEDILSSSLHKNEIHVQSEQESNNDAIAEATGRIRNTELVPNAPELPTREPDEKSVGQIPVTGQPQQIVQGTEVDRTIFGLARISTLPQDSKLLKFEIAIPKDLFWRYVEEHLGQRYNHFWITGVMNQETRKIISLSMVRNDIPQI